MAALTTATFNLQADDLVEAAFARTGPPITGGWPVASARRCLALVFQKLTLRGINLWQIEQATPLPLLKGQAKYTLAADTVDLLEVTTRDTSIADHIDLVVSRISRAFYHYIPDKQSPGRPVQFFIDRQLAAPVLFLWPAPDKSGYQLDYWRIKKPRDLGPGALLVDVDAPARWYPALVSGLAYFMAMERDGVSLEKMAALKTQWEEDFAEAAAEDSDGGGIQVYVDLTAYARL